jgi:hypothetical protein
LDLPFFLFNSKPIEQENLSLEEFDLDSFMARIPLFAEEVQVVKRTTQMKSIPLNSLWLSTIFVSAIVDSWNSRVAVLTE